MYTNTNFPCVVVFKNPYMYIFSVTRMIQDGVTRIEKENVSKSDWESYE